MTALTEQDTLSALNNYYKGKEFELVSFNYEPFKEVLGFHGSHALLKVTTKVDGEEEQLSFFVKSATLSQAVFDRYFAKIQVFFKEHVMMTQVLKDLQKVVKPKLTSECYLSKLNEAVVMENLSLLGFEVLRGQDMDLEHSKLSLQAFANFHAASIVWEEKTNQQLKEKYSEVIFETFFAETGEEEGLLKSMLKGVKDMSDEFFPSIPERHEAMQHFTERGLELVGPSKKYRNVMCQGDPWGNNVLYKYDPDGVPRESCLVDFQASRYAPPALEVIQFLYLNSTRGFREENKRFLKDHYYLCLCKALSAEGLDPETILPKDVFEESCSFYKDFGIIARILYQYLTKLPPETLLEAASSAEQFLSLMVGGESSFAIKAYQVHEGYRNIFTEAFMDLIDAYNELK